jgi:TetR/AcrR family fatty acid metabolism transcriptional regulator
LLRLSAASGLVLATRKLGSITGRGTTLTALTDRSGGQEDKRRLILDAAVRVFAHKGYHTSRVGDIAEEAGVAHGLLYHYFRSKEELLETISRETWRDVLDAVRSVEESDESARDRLAGIAKILLRAWRRDPDLVRVLVREVTRSSHLQQRIAEIEAAFAGIERIIERGQREGEFRSDLDPRMASYVFYGALEEILTGWVLGQLEDGDEAIARAEETVVEVICGGLAADRETAKV